MRPPTLPDLEQAMSFLPTRAHVPQSSIDFVLRNFGVRPGQHCGCFSFGGSSRWRSRIRFATWKAGIPACRVPKNSPGPRIRDPVRQSRNRQACGPWHRDGGRLLRKPCRPSSECNTTWPHRGRCVRETDEAAPTRSARRVRSPSPSALGTSTPTSITVVETRIPIRPSGTAA